MLPRLGGFGAGAEAGGGDGKHFNAGLEQRPCDSDVKASPLGSGGQGLYPNSLVGGV